MIDLPSLLDDAKRYAIVRRLRWPDGVRCPHCDATAIAKQGHDTTQPARQKYRCEGCRRRFDDLTGTVLAGRHRPLRAWILRLYFMRLNLSNARIARELGLNPDHAQRKSEPLRNGIVVRQTEPILAGEVECDEVYVVAGHEGHSEAAKKGSERPTGRDGRHSDDRERPANHHPAPDRAIRRAGHTGSYR